MTLSIEDLKQFRQLHSKTPGHPELVMPGIKLQLAHLVRGLQTLLVLLAEKT